MAARIAFYAPMKPPDHAIASGDREIARLITAALEAAGFEVEIASRFISYQKRPDAERFQALREEGLAEAERLIADVRSGRHAAPDLWFTYHPYCKAPDWIGPSVARALSIPYVTAEACRTRQGSDADWQGGRLAVQEAIRTAEINFCLKPSDEAYLRTFLPDRKSVVPLKPFPNADAIRADTTLVDPVPFFARHAPLIVAVGMMRPGTKILSYRLLAESLSGLVDRSWNLVVIGDGPERANVEAMFGFSADAATKREKAAGSTPFWPPELLSKGGDLPLKGGDHPVAGSSQISNVPEEAARSKAPISPLEGEMAGRPEGGAKGRIHFTGALPHADVLGWMKTADLLAWPGVGEAIGMVYLEAAACRLPVVACDVANIATVVADGESGLLATEADVVSYRAVLDRMLADKDLRRRLGAGGLQKVTREHGIGRAAAALKAAIEPLLARSIPPIEPVR
jgi:glycosyltransferase involved in cell wall biosynthesis